MRAGTLDKRIAIQRKVTVASSSGEPVEVWSAIANNRAASMAPMSGFERLFTAQLGSRQQVQFRIRWDPTVSDLTPLDRIVFPAAEATNSPTQSRFFYDIMAVNNIGRNEEVQIIAVRQPDVP
jgi:head-tail adaptor